MISYLLISLITLMFVTQQYPFYDVKKKIIVVNVSRGSTRVKSLNGLLRALAQA